MDPATIGLLLSVGGMFMERQAGKKKEKAMKRAASQQEAAGEQAQRIANQNAANIEAEGAESARRETLAGKEANAQRLARAAAGGGTTSGSTGVFLDEQTRRQDEAIDWLKKSTSSKAAIERERGDYSAMEAGASAQATRASTAGGKYAGLADLAKAGSTAFDMYNPGSIDNEELDLNAIWT